MSLKLRPLRWFAAFALLTLSALLAEVGLRAAGVIDFPLYRADERIGYIQRPDQSGSFLNERDYRFNAHSMAAGRFLPDPARFDLLLVGDSIVSGGNPLRQEDRLGPQLARAIGWNVWPVAAGGWSLQNGLTYLREHPEVVAAVDAVAFVVESSDLDGPASWASEFHHPRERPVSALAYAFSKYVLAPEPAPPPPALQVARRDWHADLRAFLESHDKPVYIFFYPNRLETSDAAARERMARVLGALCDPQSARPRCFSVADAAQWSAVYYRDEIHPTAEGDAVLAQIIARGIGAAAAPQRPAEPMRRER
jgi:lysophospholipase L1-like esterase